MKETVPERQKTLARASGTDLMCIWCGEKMNLADGLVVLGDVHICDVCVNKTRDDELMGDKALLRSMIESETNDKHFSKIEDLLKRYPKDPRWSSLLSPDQGAMPENNQALVSQWLTLNVNNPKADIAVFLTSETSPALLALALKWMQKGGRSSKRMPPAIAPLVKAASLTHEPVRPLVLDFARRWAKNNPGHAYADQVYSAIVSATRSHYDIRKAKKWYSTHKHHAHAWHVLASILEVAYWESSEPDSYAVDEATLVLKKPDNRIEMPRLVGGLVSVWPTDQIIDWAKETYEHTGLVWILIRLLWCAPDRLLLAHAELAEASWIDTEHAPEMLYALLSADPNNKFARTRAQHFLHNNPNHDFSSAIRNAMASASP